MDSSILETREEISLRSDMTVGFSPDSQLATLFSEFESRYVAPEAPPMALPAARRAVLPEVAAILLNMLLLFCYYESGQCRYNQHNTTKTRKS